jgi:hypothetical protein
MFQGQSAELMVKLLESSYEQEFEGAYFALPAAGIEHTDLTLKYWKTGFTSLSEYTLTANDWLEIGDGNYVLKLPPTLLDTLGFFWFQLSGLLIQNYEAQYQVVPTPINYTVNPSICVVSANLIDITGEPAGQEEISFRIAKIPKSSGGALINVKRITARPDAFGNFSVQLIRGSEVVVEIPKAGINNKFTVPEQTSALLLDLLPPL